MEENKITICDKCGASINIISEADFHACLKPLARELANNYFRRTQPWHQKDDLEYFLRPGNSKTVEAYLTGRRELLEKFLVPLRVLRTVLNVVNLSRGREVADEMICEIEEELKLETSSRKE